MNSLNDKLRLVFMGTAPLARECLNAIIQSSQFHVVGVVSQPDRPSGRKLHLQPTPVKEAALEAGLPIYQPENIKRRDSLEKIQSWAPDIAVVAAYGQILPERILCIPAYGCLNVHASILPKYRGAAPIQWAIFNRDPITGVTIMKMDAGMDTGDILAIEETPISPNETANELHDRLAIIGGKLIVKTIPPYTQGDLAPIPQDHSQATYARKIEKEDGHIEWTRSAGEIQAAINAFSPWPGSTSQLVDLTNPAEPPKSLKIWKVTESCHPSQSTGFTPPGTIIQANKKCVMVACGRQTFLEIEEVQFPGGRRLPISAVQSAEFFRVGQAFQP